jgi:ribosomal protein S6
MWLRLRPFLLFFNTRSTDTIKKTLEKTRGAIKNGQPRDTSNIGHRRHMMKTKKLPYGEYIQCYIMRSSLPMVYKRLVERFSREIYLD